MDAPAKTFAKSPSRYFRLFRFARRLGLALDPALQTHLRSVDFEKSVFVGSPG